MLPLNKNEHPHANNEAAIRLQAALPGAAVHEHCPQIDALRGMIAVIQIPTGKGPIFYRKQSVRFSAWTNET